MMLSTIEKLFRTFPSLVATISLETNIMDPTSDQNLIFKRLEIARNNAGRYKKYLFKN
jgi:hypothetical protein